MGFGIFCHAVYMAIIATLMYAISPIKGGRKLVNALAPSDLCKTHILSFTWSS